MRKLQTDLGDFKKGEYDGFKVGNVVRYKDVSLYGQYDEPYDMVITKIIQYDYGVRALLRKRNEVGKKRSSFVAEINLEHLKKVIKNA